jgi:hypothetical protein
MAQTSPNRSSLVFWRGGENEDWSWSQFFQKGLKDQTGPDLKALHLVNFMISEASTISVGKGRVPWAKLQKAQGQYIQ